MVIHFRGNLKQSASLKCYVKSEMRIIVSNELGIDVLFYQSVDQLHDTNLLQDHHSTSTVDCSTELSVTSYSPGMSTLI